MGINGNSNATLSQPPLEASEGVLGSAFKPISTQNYCPLVTCTVRNCVQSFQCQISASATFLFSARNGSVLESVLALVLPGFRSFIHFLYEIVRDSKSFFNEELTAFIPVECDQ